jgi:hypothetical protein
MPMLSIKWHQPAQQNRVTVIVVIYAAVFRFLRREIIPLVLGSLIARALVVESGKASSGACHSGA